MSMHANRRVFIIASVTGAGSLCAGAAFAQAKVEDTDEQAVALGYKHDTKLVDGKKYPKHDPKQHCANCQFWQGKPADPWAGCAMFGRKHIANGGWCSAWVKAPNATL